MQLSIEEEEETQKALSRMYIVRIFFISLFSEWQMFRLQHKRLQLDDLLTNRKHIIQSESHKKV